jgi:hypothetical protein
MVVVARDGFGQREQPTSGMSDGVGCVRQYRGAGQRWERLVQDKLRLKFCPTWEFKSRSDLNIEAMQCGALIQSKPLSDCEARIMGLDNSAIITINGTLLLSRKRFSGGHELGRWMRDRGTATFQ